MAYIQAYSNFDSRDLDFRSYINTQVIYGDEDGYDVRGAGHFNENSIQVIGSDIRYLNDVPIGGTIDRLLFSQSGSGILRLDTGGFEISIASLKNSHLDKNSITAQIFSGNDRIFGWNQDDYINGYGGADRMYGGQGDDTFVVDDVGDRVHESATVRGGDDTVLTSVDFKVGPNEEIEFIKAVDRRSTSSIDISGNDDSQTIFGNAGFNELIGKAGKDNLKGLDGDDVLSGGSDQDFLHGGHGADVFVFDTETVLAPLAPRFADHVRDFDVGLGNDVIGLSRTLFGDILGHSIEASEYKILTGLNRVDADDHLIYNQRTGVLFFDADGSGSRMSREVICYIENNARIQISDFEFVT